MTRIRVWIYSALAAVLATVGLATWASRARTARISRRSRRKIDEAIYETGALEHERQRVLEYVDETDELIQGIDLQIANLKEQTLAEVKRVEGLSHDQVEAELSEMGL